MDKKGIILAGMTPAQRELFSPVQLQKLFFLIDKNIPDAIGGPLFNFLPYSYGPFDRAVYDILEELSEEGLVEIVPRNTWKEYRLTDSGQKDGLELLSSLPDKIRDYISIISQFVRSLSFSQLVKIIYRMYPEMRVNSIFKE